MRKIRPKTGRKGHTSKTSFKPGVSGNPQGRPVITPTELEFKRAAQEKSMAALERIEKTGRGRGPRALEANEILLDRAWGRPRQETSLSGADGGPLKVEVKSVDPKELSDEQLRQLDAVLAGATASDTGRNQD